MTEIAAHLERVASETVSGLWHNDSHGVQSETVCVDPKECRRCIVESRVAAALAACAREAKLEEAKRAEKLLDRYREKARLLVIQTGGSYESGEAIQFLVSDYEKYKQHVAALERAVGEKAGQSHD